MARGRHGAAERLPREPDLVGSRVLLVGRAAVPCAGGDDRAGRARSPGAPGACSRRAGGRSGGGDPGRADPRLHGRDTRARVRAARRAAGRGQGLAPADARAAVEPPGPRCDDEPLRAELLEKCRLEIFDIRSLTSATLPFVLELYKGFISVFDWTMFCQLATLKGVSLSGDPEEMHAELAAAQRAGLACRTGPDRYALHPLAPACLWPGYNGTVAAMAKMDQDLIRQAPGCCGSCTARPS